LFADWAKNDNRLSRNKFGVSYLRSYKPKCYVLQWRFPPSTLYEASTRMEMILCCR